MIAAALVFTGTILGITDASATRSPVSPCTRLVRGQIRRHTEGKVVHVLVLFSVMTPA